MKKLREENQKRAQRIENRKEKQLKIIREEKIEKQRKIQRGMQALLDFNEYIHRFGDELCADPQGVVFLVQRTKSKGQIRLYDLLLQIKTD